METRVVFFNIINTSYNGGDTMTYYLIKIESISGIKEIKVPEREINNLIETAKRLKWKLSFIG